MPERAELTEWIGAAMLHVFIAEIPNHHKAYTPQVSQSQLPNITIWPTHVSTEHVLVAFTQKFSIHI